jgi:hypothetical protein
MFKLSPRFMLSPRFLALPLIALAVIVALAQVSTRSTTAKPGTEMASPGVYRAVNCSDPAKASTAACTVARDPARTVR